MKNLLERLGIESQLHPNIHSIIQAIEKRDKDIPKLKVVHEILLEKRFRLPNIPLSFAELMAHVAPTNNTEKVLNLCTGSSKMLFFLQNKYQHLTGIDRSAHAIALARYVAPDARIIHGDALWHSFDHTFDLVTCLLPRGGRVFYQDTRMPREIAFIIRSLDLLSEQGNAVFIVPYYLLYEARFDAFRQTYLRHFRQIISLPKVHPRNGQKRFALVTMSKQPADGIVFASMKAHHHFMGKALKNIPKVELKYPYNGLVPENYTDEPTTSVRFSDIVEMTTLNTVADVFQGVEIAPDKLKRSGDYLYLRNLDLQNGLQDSAPSWRYISDTLLSVADTNAILTPGDIILSSFFNNIILFEFKENHPAAVASRNQVIIRANAPDYVRTLLLRTLNNGIPNDWLVNKELALDKIKQLVVPLFQLPDLDSLGDQHISQLGSDEIEDLRQQLQGIISQFRGPTPPPDSPGVCYSILPPLEKPIDWFQPDDLEKPEIIRALSPIIRSTEPNEEPDETTTSEPQDYYLSQGLESFDAVPNHGTFPSLDFEQSLALKAFLENRLNILEEYLKKIDRKVDQVSEQISNLHTDFLSIRNLPREIDEKFFALHHALDSRLDTMIRQADKIKYYQGLTQNWLSLWHQLEADSQRFLPTAEYIFDLLSQTEEADFAPFVIQYCRSLENEMLNKLFVSYHRNWVRHDTRHELIRSALLYTPTQRFAEKIRDDRPIYTLGEMAYIMRQIQQDAQIWRTNTLLSDFREFTLSHFRDDIVKHTFLDKLGTLTSDIRNRAAHADRIDLHLAKQCQTLLRTCLNVFLYSVV